MQNNRIKEYIDRHLSKCKTIHKATPEQISAITYKKAQKTMDRLFAELESVNIQDVKEVVNNLSLMILDNHTTLKSMSKIMSHDYYTHTHSINVGIYAMYFGKHKMFEQKELEKIGLAGLMHDLGKVEVEKEIINKPTKLTTEELEEIVTHPSMGYELAIAFGVIDNDVLSAIKFHHEKIDGTGYPNGLKQNEIPYFAKVIGICDIFDALTSRRSYKEALNSFEALLLMKEDAFFRGKLDSNILSDFIKMLGG